MDAQEVSNALIGRYQDVCQYLLPNGKIKGNDYLIGGLDGSAGESMQITISGGASGRFIDFANKDHKGGNALWLWKQVKGCTYSEAIKQAKEWLGVREDDFGIKKHRTKEWIPPSPADRNGTQLAEPNSKVMDYLTLERRLDPIVLANAKVAESKDGEWIVLPYFDGPKDKEAFHIKKIKVDRPGGKKQITASTGTKRGLYAKHLIDENVSEITITEGELDALSFHSWGIPAVSMPNGVSDLSWIDVDWEWLERFERINICTDMDDPGRLVAPDLAKRLGLHRSFIVELPHKDVNECLQSNLTRETMLGCLSAAKAIELDEIKRPNEYVEEVHDYYTTDWSKRGWDTPWYPALPWRVRKAEFTILSGFSGSGKSVALNQLMLHLVQQSCKVMVASLEIKPGMTLYQMSRAALAKKHSSRPEIDGCVEWLNESVFFLDCIGTVNVKRLLSAMEYARKRHGIDVFVIDSLFKCGLDPSDFGSQREFADVLTSFCNNTGAHVILVAHSRKTQNGNEFGVPSKADVAGSSDITNAAFNVIIWWRNKLKKRKLDEARQAIPQNNEAIAEWMDAPDGKCVLDKQRFGEGEEAEVHVWFDAESLQFHPGKNKRIPYFMMK